MIVVFYRRARFNDLTEKLLKAVRQSSKSSSR